MPPLMYLNCPSIRERMPCHAQPRSRDTDLDILLQDYWPGETTRTDPDAVEFVHADTRPKDTGSTVIRCGRESPCRPCQSDLWRAASRILLCARLQITGCRHEGTQMRIRSTVDSST